MSARRRMTGRVKVPFDRIEKIAAEELADMALAKASGTSWKLTRHSAFYRCKDGSFTLQLVWHGGNGQTLTSTTRGIRLEVR
ncbi:MAG: hypothetical protein J0H60_11590 [Rhizobiales bacterium]|nr:hypothetical protein [Hyphomicrobiales bacterium]